MGNWHVVLPGDLEPKWLRGDPGRLMVWGPGEYNGAGIGIASAVVGPDGLVVSMDDSTFTDRCSGGSKDDPYAKPHSHALDITNGVTRYARPLLVETPTGFGLVGLELWGVDFEGGNEVELQPGSQPMPSIPPRPRVTVLGE